MQNNLCLLLGFVKPPIFCFAFIGLGGTMIS